MSVLGTIPSTTDLGSTNLSDFNEAVYDTVAAILLAGANITLTPNDTNNTVTIDSAGGGGGGAGVAFTDTATIDFTPSGSVVTAVSASIVAASITGTHIATTATPQITGMGIGVAPQSPHAVAILSSSVRKGYHWTDFSNYTDWKSSYLAQRFADADLTFSGRTRNFYARVTAKGPKTVADGWFGFAAEMIDRSDVFRENVLSISNPNGGQVVVTLANPLPAGTPVNAGSYVALDGVVGQTALNGSFRVATSPVSSGSTVYLETADITGNGVASSGGYMTNSAYMAAGAFAVTSHAARSTAAASNDLNGVVISNQGDKKATDGIYLGPATLVTGSGWATGMTVDAAVDIAYRVGAQSVNTAFDCSAANIIGGGAALWLPASGGTIKWGTDVLLSRTATGTLSLDLSTAAGGAFITLLPTTIASVQSAVQVGSAQTFTVNAGGGFRGNSQFGTFNINAAPNALSFVGYNFNPTINVNNAAATLREMRCFHAQPTLALSPGVGALATLSSLTQPMVMFRSAPIFSGNAGSDAGTVVSLTHFGAFGAAGVGQLGTIGTGWAITTVRGLHVAVPNSGGGGSSPATIGKFIGVDVDALTAYGGTLTNKPMGMRTMAPILYTDTADDTITNNSANVALEIDSTNKAFLLPRMTTTQRDAAFAAGSGTVIEGMMIYNTTAHALQTYNGTAWV